MKTIGTCKNCHYWRDMSLIYPELYINGKEGKCGKILGFTEGINVYYDSFPLKTSPDFGCVHWQIKERNAINPQMQ